MLKSSKIYENPLPSEISSKKEIKHKSILNTKQLTRNRSPFSENNQNSDQPCSRDKIKEETPK